MFPAEVCRCMLRLGSFTGHIRDILPKLSYCYFGLSQHQLNLLHHPCFEIVNNSCKLFACQRLESEFIFGLEFGQTILLFQRTGSQFFFQTVWAGHRGNLFRKITPVVNDSIGVAIILSDVSSSVAFVQLQCGLATWRGHWERIKKVL